VSGSGICWAMRKSAPHPRQTTTPTSHHSVFYRPDALPAPNQQRQSTEGISSVKAMKEKLTLASTRLGSELYTGSVTSVKQYALCG